MFVHRTQHTTTSVPLHNCYIINSPRYLSSFPLSGDELKQRKLLLVIATGDFYQGRRRVSVLCWTNDTILHCNSQSLPFCSIYQKVPSDVWYKLIIPSVCGPACARVKSIFRQDDYEYEEIFFHDSGGNWESGVRMKWVKRRHSWLIDSLTFLARALLADLLSFFFLFFFFYSSLLSLTIPLRNPFSTLSTCILLSFFILCSSRLHLPTLQALWVYTPTVFSVFTHNIIEHSFERVYANS